jgi:hypothetical protein
VKGLMGQNYEKTEQNGKLHLMCVQNLYLCETINNLFFNKHFNFKQHERKTPIQVCHNAHRCTDVLGNDYVV